MKYSKLFVVLIVGSFLTFTACAVSEERVLELAQESFAEKMAQEPKPQTYITDELAMYVPSYTKVNEIDDYNLILERDGHIFLLFLNDFVEYGDREDVLEELMIEEEPFILEMKKNGDEVGYFVVTEQPDGEFTIVVGYDGVKITTITDLSNINNIAEMMFDIVHSVTK
ncbi:MULTISPECIES: hypothetical protein [Bacillaceae]|uniref:DUF4367 domain-containing protein n=1 Tax=Evansella alkalicola TaxID=745819 RepID=A0ABS6JSN3_9BACI|nr:MULTISPECIES: hypothetical protein [Bacillaceae]MBU9721081.1 hypothetical protein [Bacillus alkalicola]